MFNKRTLACLLGTVSILPAAGPAAMAQATGVELSRSQYGIAQVKAQNYTALGYGVGYAQASDNLCLISEYFMSLAGERSRYLGIEGANASNVGADLLARYYYAPDRARVAFGKAPARVREMFEGYVAGYNSYLRQKTASLPAECADSAWVRPITLDDIYRLVESRSTLMSAKFLGPGLIAAAPPSAIGEKIASAELPPGPSHRNDLGSNGWAFGAETTVNRRGLVVGNPHFPWQGENRFYQLHLTIDGEIDVMGATLPGIPMVTLGFNKDVAWTHTVSAANRYTLFELQLGKADPTTYLVDGKLHKMRKVPVEIEVRAADGSVTTRRHIFYETIHGPVVTSPAADLGWSKTTAFAAGDVSRTNFDQFETWLEMGKAHDVSQLREAAARRGGLPWVNLIAADRNGQALYADYSRMPNVTADLLGRCKPSPSVEGLTKKARAFILDGSSSRCNWTSAKTIPGGSMLPASAQPSILDEGYVANANDSYWLTRAGAPSPILSPIVGQGAVPQNFRTRMQLHEIARVLTPDAGSSARPISSDIARELMFGNRNYAADMVLDNLDEICRRAAPDMANACDILAGWDRTNNLSSRGAPLFNEFWLRVNATPDLFATPFDPADAVNTPRDLNVGNPDVVKALVGALRDAVQSLTSHGFAIDASLGEMQTVTRNGKVIPISGGSGVDGVLNVMRNQGLTRDGYAPVHGTSYVQIVSFDDDGPIADGILAYDQSSDPQSPYYSMQTELFARGQFYRLPFTAAQIAAEPGRVTVNLPDDPILHRRAR
ncbi:MAG: penicillin acylase family protein [Sphingomonadales bacterium]|nr:penicillin acylase family protein [Sphingomonadales bacterium]